MAELNSARDRVPARVVVCGSLAHPDLIAGAVRAEKERGVHTVVYPRRDGLGDEQAAALWRREIALADEVVVVCKPDGSIGESVAKELADAEERARGYAEYITEGQRAGIGDIFAALLVEYDRRGAVEIDLLALMERWAVELAQLRAQRDAALAQHPRETGEDGTEFCGRCVDRRGDLHTWPCPTAAALGATEPR